MVTALPAPTIKGFRPTLKVPISLPAMSPTYPRPQFLVRTPLGVRLAAWTALMAAFGILAGLVIRHEIQSVALSRAKESFRKDVVYRQWVTERGGVYVPLDAKTPANPYLTGIPNREIQGSDGRTYTLVNPAYMTRMVHELGRQQYGLQGHITSLKPLRPENAADAWETTVLHRFDQGEPEVWEVVSSPQGPQLRYMSAFLVQEGCLRCHARQGYQVGEVRGGISITVPLNSLWATPAYRVLMGGFLVLWLTGLATILLLARRESRLQRDRNQALERLRESQLQYQSLVECLPMRLYRLDQGQHITYLNPPFLKDLGLPPESCLNRPISDFEPPDQEVQHRKENELALQGTTLRHLESRNGRTLEVMKIPVRDAQGAIVGIQVMFWDVSERISMEQALKDQAERFQQLIQTTPDGFWLVGKDTRLVEVNETYCRMSGYTREELLSMRIQDLEAAESPEETRRHLERLRHLGSDRFETQHRRKDGQLIRLEAHATLMGASETAMAFFSDITPRVLAQQALQESEARFRTLIEQSPMPVFVHQEGRIVYCNGASQKLLGADAEDQLLGRSMEDLVHETTPAEGVFVLPPQASTLRAQMRLRTFDGRTVDVEALQTPIQFGKGPAVLLFLEDLTERNRAAEQRRHLEEEIQHTQKLESLGALASGVAHDMNNILAAVLSTSSVLHDRFADEPKTREGLATLVRAAERGRDLVKSLTDFSRKGLQEAQVLDVNELMAREAALIARTSFQKVAVKQDLQPDLPKVLGEPGALENALMNLCLNALDAMDPGGTLTLRTRTQEGMVLMEVEDTGHGMPPGVMSRAFEPFFTTKAPGKGTGLGLAMVYGTLKAHGGRVNIESQPGKGTCITLHLPAHASDTPHPEAHASALASSNQPRRILLVDDDELIRDSVPMMIEALGHTVETAASGEEALARLGEGLEVDLIILDQHMPGMSGLETLERLRPIRPDLPVLLASGFQNKEVEASLKRIPQVSALMKPYTLEEIKAAITTCLGG